MLRKGGRARGPAWSVYLVLVGVWGILLCGIDTDERKSEARKIEAKQVVGKVVRDFCRDKACGDLPAYSNECVDLAWRSRGGRRSRYEPIFMPAGLQNDLYIKCMSSKGRNEIFDQHLPLPNLTY